MTNPRAGTPVEDANTIAAEEAIFLSDLAAGKYDKQWGQVRGWMMMAVPFAPSMRVVIMILDIMIRINKMTAPNVPVVADGRGGFVPITNSRYNPKTGQFVDGPFGEN